MANQKRLLRGETLTHKHSPEPWEWIGGVPAITCRWNGKHVVLAEVVRPEWHEDRTKASEEAGANAERIVACVNACKGITNEELRNGVISRLIGKSN